MALRCFLFSSDEGSSDLIRQVLTGLGIEGEICSEAATAVERLASELFQIVVIDWDRQPEAAMLLSAARERKPADRPLTLAIVSDDTSVPRALQAGANSILKKPVQANQVTDTLTTARDLLRSRQESAGANKAAAAAAASSVSSRSSEPDRAPRAGMQFPAVQGSPGAQFETDTEVAHFPDQSAAEQINPLKDLEPVAAAVAEEPAAGPSPNEPKGLEWYLKARGVVRQPSSVFVPQAAPPKENKPELLGYDETPASPASSDGAAEPPKSDTHSEKSEPQIFSSYEGDSSESSEAPASRFPLGKRAIVAALLLASLAVAAAPQAPWHPRAAVLWSNGRRILHGWLNPQAVTTVTQAPAAHEDFSRPGDEYKLPVAENIPDATTDPSQINVVPVVDPTVKKPTPDAGTSDPAAQPTVVPETTPTAPPDSAQPPAGPASSQPAPSMPAVSQPASSPALTITPATTQIAPPASTPAVTTPSPAPVPHRQPAPYVPSTTNVPSSLRSQLAVMTPDASGNKPIESAMPAIEPVEVPELSERALLTSQPPVAYPSSAAGKQGTVILQVLIGRDGSVQDAKFLQGSLAFAHAATDGVKRWKFKPYTVNGRPVSVQTNMTLRFAPAQ